MQPVNTCSTESCQTNTLFSPLLNPFSGWIFPRPTVPKLAHASSSITKKRSVADTLINEIGQALLLVEKTLEEMKLQPSAKGDRWKLYETIKYRLELAILGIRNNKNKKGFNDSEIKAEVLFALSRLASKHLNKLCFSHSKSHLFLEAKLQKLQSKMKTLSSAMKITNLILDQELLCNEQQLNVVEGILKDTHAVLKSEDCCTLKISENKPMIQMMSVVNSMIEEFDQSEQFFDAEKWYFTALNLKDHFFKKYNKAFEVFEPLAIVYFSKKTKL